MAAASVLLIGCAAPGPRVCTAIGFINTLDVEVASSYEVSAVHLCVEGECVGPGARSPSLGPLIRFVDRDSNTWSFETDMQTPDPIMLQFFDDAGQLREERSVDVEWVQVDELDPCGSASRARVEIAL
jgi:hypothetical protein